MNDFDLTPKMVNGKFIVMLDNGSWGLLTEEQTQRLMTPPDRLPFEEETRAHHEYIEYRAASDRT